MEDNWKNNKLQFARLITELDLAGVFGSSEGDESIMDILKESMDLEESDICDLIERAQFVFDAWKAEQ